MGVEIEGVLRSLEMLGGCPKLMMKLLEGRVIVGISEKLADTFEETVNSVVEWFE